MLEIGEKVDSENADQRRNLNVDLNASMCVYLHRDSGFSVLVLARENGSNGWFGWKNSTHINQVVTL